MIRRWWGDASTRQQVDGAVPRLMERLPRRQINRATLARQMLLRRADDSAVTAVERLIGMQTQEPRPPFIGLWSRLSDFERQDLLRALQRREIVRGTLMRGTLHVMSAADYAAYRPSLQPVLTRAMSALGERAAGLDPERVLPVATELLRERPRTFGELRSLLKAEFPGVNDRALGFCVRMLLPLVMVPTQATWGFPANAQFTLAETWLDRPLAPGDGTATHNLVLRYLAAFGPATVADVQTWSGLQALKPVLAALRPQLRVFRDERGKELFDLPDAPRPEEDTPAPPRFLPEFDNLLLSHADRTRVLADAHRPLVTVRANLRVRATFLVDGFVCGTWQTARKRSVATLTLAPFGLLTQPDVAALVEEGEALLRFLEDDATHFEVRLDEPSVA
jgi:hypothetical protein